MRRSLDCMLEGCSKRCMLQTIKCLQKQHGDRARLQLWSACCRGFERGCHLAQADAASWGQATAHQQQHFSTACQRADNQ